ALPLQFPGQLGAGLGTAAVDPVPACQGQALLRGRDLVSRAAGLLPPAVTAILELLPAPTGTGIVPADVVRHARRERRAREAGRRREARLAGPAWGVLVGNVRGRPTLQASANDVGDSLAEFFRGTAAPGWVSGGVRLNPSLPFVLGNDAN